MKPKKRKVRRIVLGEGPLDFGITSNGVPLTVGVVDNKEDDFFELPKAKKLEGKRVRIVAEVIE